MSEINLVDWVLNWWQTHWCCDLTTWVYQKLFSFCLYLFVGCHSSVYLKPASIPCLCQIIFVSLVYKLSGIHCLIAFCIWLVLSFWLWILLVLCLFESALWFWEPVLLIYYLYPVSSLCTWVLWYHMGSLKDTSWVPFSSSCTGSHVAKLFTNPSPLTAILITHICLSNSNVTTTSIC